MTTRGFAPVSRQPSLRPRKAVATFLKPASSRPALGELQNCTMLKPGGLAALGGKQQDAAIKKPAQSKMAAVPMAAGAAGGGIRKPLARSATAAQLLAKKPLPKTIVKATVSAPAEAPKPGVDEACARSALPSPVEEEKARLTSGEKAFSEKLLSQIEDIDADDGPNPQLVTQYVEDIFAHMRRLETETCIQPTYLSGQRSVNGRMRRILVGWLAEVHMQFKLLQETLFMTVSMLDLFLQADNTIARDRFQLLGVTCLYVASKYEEMYAPDLQEFVFVTDSAYTMKDIKDMELLVLKRTDFKLGRPLPIHFLRRFSKAGAVNPVQHNIAKYLMELSLLDHNLASVKPSMAAATALLLAMSVTSPLEPPQIDEIWTPTLTYHSRYTAAELKPAMKKFAQLLFWDAGRIRSIHNKYSSRRLMQVSTLPELGKQWLRNLAL